MSLRKSKLDLLVRVRYSNPLPAPPCPPKLLDIPTNPLRYSKADFLNSIANDIPLPLIVDAECGMPLDLGRWECLWDDDADDSALNPDPSNLPILDPKDQFLLGDPSTTSHNYANGTSSSASSSIPATPAHVTWLRKTEYLSREGVQRSSANQEPKHLPQHIDVSHVAQLRDIEASFAACNDSDSFSLASLRHPNKPGVTAVESYEIFPDADIWANAYDLFRFSERPGEKAVEIEDPRLDCAILRPMESDGDHFLAYYLTKDDESAISFKADRLENTLQEGDGEPGSTAFHFVRDYQTVKIEQEVPNEFFTPGEERSKAAYYKNIERKMTLKKKRTNALESYGDKWQVVHISHLPMSKEELEEREELLAEVNDPMYLLNRNDADADGEIDDGGNGIVETRTAPDGKDSGAHYTGGDTGEMVDIF
ncbi:RNA polymerase II-associated [Hygrophoropsis aurantiaca]|uniref:RNA polymerase II-associated n=1 Tax=Hygrophoropsis aurantiaca TaxID=72124 RepID=A0ACB8A4A7_9AGAM|nr:RNA polymerase II-associated [Hygrophoropsis aurantiaca]